MHLLLALLLTACSQHGAHHHANKHMHKSSHEELIKKFDDPARDQQQRPDVVMKLISPVKGLEVIDIGVGSGYFAKYLLEAGAKVTGADVDDKFLEFVEKKFPLKEYPHFKTLKIAYDDPGMEPNSYDLVFIANTYHHLADRISYLKKIRLGLKESGRLVIFDFRKYPKTLSGPPIEMRVMMDEAVPELEKAGFKNIVANGKDFEDHYLIISTK